MYIDNKVVKEFDEGECYDKFAVATTLLDMSYRGAACSLLESKVLSNCENCTRSYLCSMIDEVIEEYTEKTTVVTASFNFES